MPYYGRVLASRRDAEEHADHDGENQITQVSQGQALEEGLEKVECEVEKEKGMDGSKEKVGERKEK